MSMLQFKHQLVKLATEDKLQPDQIFRIESNMDSPSDTSMLNEESEELLMSKAAQRWAKERVPDVPFRKSPSP